MTISFLTHMTDQKEKRTVTTMTHAVILGENFSGPVRG